MKQFFKVLGVVLCSLMIVLGVTVVVVNFVSRVAQEPQEQTLTATPIQTGTIGQAFGALQEERNFTQGIASATPTEPYISEGHALAFIFSTTYGLHYFDTASTTMDWIQMQRDSIGKESKHYSDVQIKIGDWFNREMSWEEFMRRMK